MKRINLLILIACIPLLTHCAYHTPSIPVPVKQEYLVKDFQADYKVYVDAYKGSQLDKARIYRDYMIDRIMKDIEQTYGEFEGRFYNSRAGAETAGDVIAIGLTSAAAATPSSATVKAILAAAATGFKGSTLSFENNFYRNKTTEIIFAKIRASRMRLIVDIRRQEHDLDVRNYSFDAAWMDLVRLFYAGTIQGGIQELAADTGKDAAQAKQETKEAIDDQIRNLKALPSVSSAQRDQITQLRSRFNDLFNKKDTTAAKNVLKALGVTVDNQASDEEVFDLLNLQIRRLILHPEDLDKTLTAFGLK